MLSPEHSDIRKSLDSIQSMLSQNPSPLSNSLSSRIHRASMGMEQQQTNNNSPPYQQQGMMGGQLGSSIGSSFANVGGGGTS